MVVRKYENEDGSYLEVWVDKDNVLFQINNNVTVAIPLTYDDVNDLYDSLYDLKTQIEPKKDNG